LQPCATEETQVADPMAHSPPYPGTPRWVKVFGIIAIVLLLFVLFNVLTGGGGP
jgi:hypothetical protein